MRVAELGDLVAHPDEPSEDGLLTNDAGVVGRVGGGGDELGEGVDELAAADLGELPHPLELGADGDDVDLFAAVVKCEDGAIDGAMRVAVEVVGLQGLDRGRDRVRIDEHGPQDRLLGLVVVWRDVRRDRRRMHGFDRHEDSFGRRAGTPPRRGDRPRRGPGCRGRGPKSTAGPGRLLASCLRQWLRSFSGPAAGAAPAAELRSVARAFYSGTTMIFTEATNPSATSTSTMNVPSSLMGSSSRTLRLSML